MYLYINLTNVMYSSLMYFMVYVSFSSVTPSPPPDLNHTFKCTDSGNCTSPDSSTLATCTCQSVDLLLTWEHANGEFDLLHYLVNISGNIMYVTTTSFTMRAMPETSYLMLVSTVSKCQQTSSAAELNIGELHAYR